MINRTLHSSFWIIEFMKLDGEKVLGEKLYAIKRRLGSAIISPPAGFEPETPLL